MAQKKKQGTDLLYELIGIARTFPDTIILGRGDPDFDTPAHIVEAAAKAMHDHGQNYVPPEGLLALRQAIARRTKTINGFDVDPETEVVVTNGGQEALFLMIVAALNPGDEIIIPEPNYNTYVDAVNFARGVKVGLPSYAENDFRVTPQQVRAAITDRTRALLMVSPNNPTASVISPEDTAEYLKIAQENDLVIIADDIYDLFVYDDFKHTNPSALPGGKGRTLTLNALSKAYSMTGWRLGWIVGPAVLMKKVAQLKTAVTGGTSIVSQYAGLAALEGPQEPVQAMRAAYVRRRRIVLDALDEMGIEYGMPQGGQFVFADVGYTGMDVADLARKILVDQHVLAYPGSAFDRERGQYLRMTFLQPEEKLREGLRRMKLVIDEIVGHPAA